MKTLDEHLCTPAHATWFLLITLFVTVAAAFTTIAFNIAGDYSANVSGTLTLPVYKRLALSFTATDNFLNNPSAGYNKNSSQFVAAASYTLK